MTVKSIKKEDFIGVKTYIVLFLMQILFFMTGIKLVVAIWGYIKAEESIVGGIAIAIGGILALGYLCSVYSSMRGRFLDIILGEYEKNGQAVIDRVLVCSLDNSFKEEHHGQYREYIRQRRVEHKEDIAHLKEDEAPSGYFLLYAIAIMNLLGEISLYSYIAIALYCVVCIHCVLGATVIGLCLARYFKPSKDDELENRNWRIEYQQALDIRKEFESCASPDELDKLCIQELDRAIKELERNLGMVADHKV